MISPKEYLNEKLIEFQKNIALLRHTLKTREAAAEKKEQALLLELCTVLDAFDQLEETLAAQQSEDNKPLRMMTQNIRAIHKKMIRIFQSMDIAPMTFPDNKAQLEFCKVLATRPREELENETILKVVKKGYIEQKSNKVLRKAEVITVFNG